jgi:anti-anti-sigma regulatory factor
VYHNTQLRQLVNKFQQLADRRQPIHPPPVASSAPLFPPPQVARVDDPYGEMSLVAVHGDVEHDTIDQLQNALADLPNGRFVHLDLDGATIRSGWAMRLLEAIADDLERRGIVLRVVGLDPQHPMLTPTL